MLFSGSGLYFLQDFTIPRHRTPKLSRLTMDCLKGSIMRHSIQLDLEQCRTISCIVHPYILKRKPRSSVFMHLVFTDYQLYCKSATVTYPVQRVFHIRPSMRTFSLPVSLNEEPSVSQGSQLNIATELASQDDEELFPQKPERNELKSLLADSERARLLRKLSEANQYNRFLKRQLQMKDTSLVNFKSELAVLELELQALVGLAEEVAGSDLHLGSRKINGKYLSSHLLSRLQAVREKVKEHIDDINFLEVKEITIFWVGMAENVQVMGSFDGWSQGEYMSSDCTDSYVRFTTTLKLRPGRYEIKFLVDGEWQLSPEFPEVGEGMLRNNLLVVE